MQTHAHILNKIGYYKILNIVHVYGHTTLNVPSLIWNIVPCAIE